MRPTTTSSPGASATSSRRRRPKRTATSTRPGRSSICPSSRASGSSGRPSRSSLDDLAAAAQSTPTASFTPAIPIAKASCWSTRSSRSSATAGRSIASSSSNLNPAAVRRRSQHPRAEREVPPFSDSALARQRADWLYGMNMTRLYTLLGRQARLRRRALGRPRADAAARPHRRGAIAPSRPSVPRRTSRSPPRFARTPAPPFERPGCPGPEHAAHLDSDKRLLRREVADAVVRATSGKLGRSPAAPTSRDARRRPCPTPSPTSRWTPADTSASAPSTCSTPARASTRPISSRPIRAPIAPTCRPSTTRRLLPSSQRPTRQAPSLAPLLAGADLSLRSKAWDDAKVTAHHAIIPTPAPGPQRALNATEARRLRAHRPALPRAVLPALRVRPERTRHRPRRPRVPCDGTADHRARMEGRPFAEPSPKPHAKPAADDPPPTRRFRRSVRATLCVLNEVARRRKDDRSRPSPSPTTPSSRPCAKSRSSSPTPPSRRSSPTPTASAHPPPAAAIIETLFERGYVERRKKTIVSTATGRALIDALPAVRDHPGHDRRLGGRDARHPRRAPATRRLPRSSRSPASPARRFKPNGVGHSRWPAAPRPRSASQRTARPRPPKPLSLRGGGRKGKRQAPCTRTLGFPRRDCRAAP